LSPALARTSVPPAPVCLTTKDIKLISFAPVGKDGVAPEGNKKSVAKPTVTPVPTLDGLIRTTE